MFPKPDGITSKATGGGLTVEVRFVKQGGLPITYNNDPDVEVAAIREVDLEKKFHMGAYDLADKAKVDRTRATSLRRHLGLDDDADHFSHLFRLGSQKVRRYSDNGLKAMKKSKDEVDLATVWAAHRTIPSHQKTVAPLCDQPGCVGAKVQGLPDPRLRRSTS